MLDAVVTLDEFRDAKAAALRDILRLPGMYAPDAWSMYARVEPLVQDLATLNDLDRPQAWDPVSADRFDQYGVPGLERWFHQPPRCAPEVASLYAEVSSRLGFIEVQHRLSAHDWTQNTFDTGEAFRSRDWTMSELAAELPPPSLLVGKTVVCYAQADRTAAWAYLDFIWEPDEQQLRNVRLPAPKAVDGLVFTPFGRRYDNRR